MLNFFVKHSFIEVPPKVFAKLLGVLHNIYNPFYNYILGRRTVSAIVMTTYTIML